MAKKTVDETETEVKATTSTYKREQICSSERFRNDRDILAAILNQDQDYTLPEIEEAVKKFKEGAITEQINGGGR
ncbi:MAG: hypothetical protein ACRDBM_02705 [Sporomusa sp.]